MYKGNPLKKSRHFGRNRRGPSSLYYSISPNGLWYVEGRKIWITTDESDGDKRRGHTICSCRVFYNKSRTMREVLRISKQYPEERVWIFGFLWKGGKRYLFAESCYQNGKRQAIERRGLKEIKF